MKVLSRVVGLVAAGALAITPALVLTGAASGAATSEVFTTVGSKEWTVPAGVTCVTAEAIGAQGGAGEAPSPTAASNNGNAAAAAEGDGGLGGSGTMTFAVSPGATLQVNVGGRGGDSTRGDSDDPVAGGDGGFNGGGDGGTPEVVPDPQDPPRTISYSAGAGGGGASDVRLGGTALADRVAIGGGGAGVGGFSGFEPGAGGGTTGGDGGDQANSTGGTGATQSAGGIGGGNTNPTVKTGTDGTLGQGGTGGGGDINNGGGGGGGGGLYGGGGGGGVRDGESSASAGGGGSGLGTTVASGVDADNEGDGQVTLSYTVGDTSCLPVPVTPVAPALPLVVAARFTG